MERGVDFLRTQVSNAVAAHRVFLRAVEDHESQSKDERYRELCVRSMPRILEHQLMLEQYQQALGSSEGLMKKATGMALGMVRDFADIVRDDDFTHLASDIVMARMLEDTFKTFREAGRTLGLQQLARIGEVGERHHDDYVKEANRLIQQMFAERVQGDGQYVRAVEQPMAGA